MNEFVSVHYWNIKQLLQLIFAYAGQVRLGYKPQPMWMCLIYVGIKKNIFPSRLCRRIRPEDDRKKDLLSSGKGGDSPVNNADVADNMIDPIENSTVVTEAAPVTLSSTEDAKDINNDDGKKQKQIYHSRRSCRKKNVDVDIG